MIDGYSMGEPICTWVIIALTVLSSVMGFRDPAFTEKFIFAPTEVLACKQYYRLVTSAFLHADLGHLIMNMMTLYFFGSMMELDLGPVPFLGVYFAAIIGGSLLSLWLHRNHDYRAYGASGGACGMVFSFIALNPKGTILAHFFFPIPAWGYGILFLVGSFVALKRNRDNVGHDAHLGGAVIGLWTTGAFQPSAVRENWGWFLILSGIALALFFYFWKNPMLLPLWSVMPEFKRPKKSKKEIPPHRRESYDVDAILDKISREGVESLTAEEKAFLDRVSTKYQNRAKSEKPKSDLII
jgi:membrane associated rhomboid family serine protease